MRSWMIDIFWVLTLGLLSSVWCLTAGREIGPTFDEPFHIEGGLHFWRTGSFGPLLQKGAMPLPMATYAAPVRFYELWRGQPIDLVAEHDTAMLIARPATLVFWWVLLVYAYLIGARISGSWGGRLAAALAAFEPTLLAQAALASTDTAIAAAVLVFAFHFSAGRDCGWWRRVGLCGLLYGIALFTKASALAFCVLIMVTIEWTRVWGQQSQDTSTLTKIRICLATLFGPRFRWDAIQIVALGLLSVFVFCGSDWQTEPSFVAWAQSLPDGVFGRSMVWLSEHLTVFSNAGVAIVRQIKHNMQGHGAYLLGNTSPRALWYFFPVALTIKLTLFLLLLPVLLLILSPRSLGNRILAIAAVLLLFSFNCRVQIGVRLVLPLVALAAVGLGAALGDALTRALPAWRRLTLTAAATVGIGWMAFSVVSVWPHGLCYTNELWGGIAHAHECVSGSDFDWGQGVRELDHWRGERGVSLLYYGTDPLAQSDHFSYLHADQLPSPSKEQMQALTGGNDLAVSVSLLYGPRLKHDRLNALLDYLRTCKPADRTTFFVIYRFAPAERQNERADVRADK